MKIAVLPGDGIGSEIIAQAIKVLERLALPLELQEAPVGGAGYDASGDPLPEATLALAREADAILFGAVGGWTYDALPRAKRPEQAILGLRKSLGLFANLRPVQVHEELVGASTLKPEVVAGLDLHHCDNVGGIRENLVGTTLSDRAVASAISHPFAAGDASYRTRPGLQVPREVDTVFCGCYRRSVFERIGVFNEALLRTQDREFNQRLRAAGGKIVLDPAIRCWYHPRVSLLAHIQWTWDGAFWLFMARRFTDTSMLRPRNYVPFLFVAWHAAPVALLPLSPPLAALSACPLLFYWFLNLAFSTQVAFREGRPGLLAVLPWYFAGTHYAYGLASLAGAMVGWTHPRQVYPTTPSPPLSVPIPPTRDD